MTDDPTRHACENCGDDLDQDAICGCTEDREYR